MKRVHRLQNPFEHWVRGLATEIIVSVAFVLAGILMCLAIAAAL